MKECQSDKTERKRKQMQRWRALKISEDKEAERRYNRERKASERANKTHEERQEERNKDNERKLLSKKVVEINDSKKAEISNNIESKIASTNVNENESYATQSAIINEKIRKDWIKIEKERRLKEQRKHRKKKRMKEKKTGKGKSLKEQPELMK